MKIISPRRMFLAVLMMTSLMGQAANAQGLQGVINFFTTFDFVGVFVQVCPALTTIFGFFNTPLPFFICEFDDDDGVGDDGAGDDGGGTDDEPAPAPTKKGGKVVTGTAVTTAAPVPPSASP